jgi:NitT/TauT family transport system ATP-binding protein
MNPARTTRQSRESENVVQNVQTDRGLFTSDVVNNLNGSNALNASNPLVEIQGISKSFYKVVKDQTIEVKALADVSLSIRDKEFLSIIGPSGCGKTTLLKMIDGLIPYDSGKILINGKQINAPGPDRAVVFQWFALLPWRTVLANVEFSLELRRLSKEERTQTARDY